MSVRRLFATFVTHPHRRVPHLHLTYANRSIPSAGRPRRRCRGVRTLRKGAGAADEHPLYHDRRPYGADDELLRRPLCLDAPSRPHRRRGRALHQQLRGQLVERSQPRLHAHGQALPQERLHRQHLLRPVRRRADHLSQAAAAGRVRDGRRRQVAPREPPDGLRPLGGGAGAGRLLQPRLHPPDGRHGALRGVSDRHRHRQEHRVAPGAARPRQALLSAGPPQGAAPHLDGRHVPSGALRGPRLPAARDLLRRLRGASGRRRAGDVDRLGPRHGPGLRPEDVVSGRREPSEPQLRGDDRTDESRAAGRVGPLLRAPSPRSSTARIRRAASGRSGSSTATCATT